MNDEVEIPDGGSDSMPARRGAAVASPLLGLGSAVLAFTPVGYQLVPSPVAVVLLGLSALGLVCGIVGLYGAWKEPGAHTEPTSRILAARRYVACVNPDGVVALLGQVVAGIPSVPGAACRGRPGMFDDVVVGETHDQQRGRFDAALAMCRDCDAQAACAAALPPGGRLDSVGRCAGRPGSGRAAARGAVPRGLTTPS